MAQLGALDARLNQNSFVGLAATRIDLHQIDYLYGRSVWEGALALVPRALWPEKPVFAGSGSIVANFTGLNLNKNTSWGVGNVMEFEINFGWFGVIGGFFILGWAIAKLDRSAALAEFRGDFGNTILFFLPAVAMIQPNGSLVEVVGGAGAAVGGGLFFRWIWNLSNVKRPVAVGRQRYGAG